MAHSLLSLPPELWPVVLDNLSRKDHLYVSQVSPQLCVLARRAIYREVDLYDHKNGSPATLALLARDHSVACNVEVLRIFTSDDRAKGPPWFNPNAFAGMARLRHLVLNGMPFSTRKDQERFNGIMSESLPALKKLEYTGMHWTFYPDPKLVPNKCVPILEIKGLEDVTWIVKCA